MPKSPQAGRRHSAAYSSHSSHRRSSRNDSADESVPQSIGSPRYFFRYASALVPDEDRFDDRDDSYFPKDTVYSSYATQPVPLSSTREHDGEDVEAGTAVPSTLAQGKHREARRPTSSPSLRRPAPASRIGTYTREQIREEKRITYAEEEIGEGFDDESWLAAVMCSDRKLAIFRRFDELTTEVLLHYVRRLENLEAKLAATNMVEELESEQRQAVLDEIEGCLMNYFDLLSTHASSLKYKTPNRKDLKALNHYRHLTYPHLPPLVQEEVLALAPRPDDMFELITDYNSPFMRFGRFLQRIKRAIIPRNPKKHHKKPRDWTSSTSRSAKIARFIITFLAPLMTLVPIIVLYYLPTANARLLTVVLFTMGFTAILGISDASNADVLAGSTGYAAVLVVFVGTGAFAG